MRYVSIIDATGLKSFGELIGELHKRSIRVCLTELGSEQVKKEMEKAGILTTIVTESIFPGVKEVLDVLVKTPEERERMN